MKILKKTQQSEYFETINASLLQREAKYYIQGKCRRKKTIKNKRGNSMWKEPKNQRKNQKLKRWIKFNKAKNYKN
jgi:hypothetical protein